MTQVQQLWADLNNLVATSEAFYHQDFELGYSRYRIFNYRLASYTDFCQPNALEARGIMFEIDVHGNLVRLAARPMEKFFNLHENPFTIGLDMSKIRLVEIKADGSIMTTFVHEGDVRLKSKGSLFSEQALAANSWLERHPGFKDELRRAAQAGLSVNMEWCAPQHRIVIGYPEAHLKVLNVRDNETGEYIELDDDAYPLIRENWVERWDVNSMDRVAFVEGIPAMTDIEGFVVQLESGQRVKIKTEWYLALHHVKDSINNPRRLYEAVVYETIDDMRSMFYDDPVATQQIDDMQELVDGIYNHMVKLVEDFHDANKGLDRKSYAVLGQEKLDRKYFGLAMTKYLGQAVDYRQFMIKNYKDFGIRDTVLNPE